jgi:hypothetical protein
MAASIWDWSKVAGSNGNADSGIDFTEGQTPGSLNDSARQLMARVAELRDDITGTITAGGTANALTVTANSGFTIYANGRMVAFIAASDNTSSATLNVNGIGAKSVRKMDASGDVALTGGEIQAGGVYLVVYNTAMNGAAGGWLLLNPTPVITVTETASTSGTSVDFTGIPAAATEITVSLAGVSTNGTSNIILQLGDSGGIETSGYTGSYFIVAGGLVTSNGAPTTYFLLGQSAAANLTYAAVTLRRLVSSSNTWVCSAQGSRNTGGGEMTITVGSKPTSAALDRVRVTTANGTDTFDAGTITMSYR